MQNLTHYYNYIFIGNFAHRDQLELKVVLETKDHKDQG